MEIKTTSKKVKLDSWKIKIKFLIIVKLFNIKNFFD